MFFLNVLYFILEEKRLEHKEMWNLGMELGCRIHNSHIGGKVDGKFRPSPQDLTMEAPFKEFLVERPDICGGNCQKEIALKLNPIEEIFL